MSSLGDLGSALLGSLYAQRVPFAIAGVVAIVALALVARRRGWIDVTRRHPRVAAALMAGALVVGLPLAWYLGSPVFLSTTLEEPPIVAAASSPTPTPRVAVSSPATPRGASPTSAPTSTPDPTATPWVPAADRSGSFSGTDDFHFGRGTATLRETAPGEWAIRFDDFSVRNGPDLYVYLSPDAAGYADDAIEVARLRATDGSFNTKVPPGTDVSSARSVLIWCKQFSHLFAVAPLTS